MFNFFKGAQASVIKRFVALFLFVFLLFSEICFAQSFNSTEWRRKTTKSLTTFQPGDAVRIQIWELFREEKRNLNLSRDYPINPGGYIIMPFLGEVKVKDLTAYELIQILEKRYSEYLKNPYVYIRPLIRITMQGAFNRPGSYRADPSSSLWDMVALAGGPRQDADLERIKIERGGKVVISNVLHAFEKGYSLEDIGIETGDQMIVPRRRQIDLSLILTIVTLATSLTLLYLRIRFGAL